MVQVPLSKESIETTLFIVACVTLSSIQGADLSILKLCIPLATPEPGFNCQDGAIQQSVDLRMPLKN